MENDLETGAELPGKLTRGYTQIPNKLLEAAYRLHCSGGELALILVVLRYTYGFQRASHKLGLAFLARATHRSRTRVSISIRRLVANRVLLVESPPSWEHSRTIAVNTRHEEWGSPVTMTVSESEYTPVYGSGDRGIPVHGNQEIKNKENSKKLQTTSKRKTIEEQAFVIYEHYRQKVRAGARTDAIRSIAKLLKTYPPELLLGCIDRYAGNGMNRDPTYRFQANNFFGRAEHFKDYLFDKNESFKRSFSPLQDDLQRQSDCQVEDSQNTKVIQ